MSEKLKELKRRKVWDSFDGKELREKIGEEIAEKIANDMMDKRYVDGEEIFDLCNNLILDEVKDRCELSDFDDRSYYLLCKVIDQLKGMGNE